jgi:Zn-dependent peptidase ImmA (M78 family)/DNA-binding XRE family transcriptional regulator
MKRIYQDINPRNLIWARERARYSQEELAKKVGVTPDKYRQWESGDAKPTIHQLYDLVHLLNRSLQLFFMEKTPDEPEMLAEMRRLPGSLMGEESPQLAQQVQLATQRRGIALRLYEDLGETPPSLGISASINDDTDQLAASIRNELKITLAQQTSWNNEYGALREWRSALEDAGVLIFQIPGVSIREMRGFSFSFQPLPIIGFNSNDWPRGRIFTILHEFSHILLRENVLDSAGKNWFQLDSMSPIERFCNRVAGAALVPSEDIRKMANLYGRTRKDNWEDLEIGKLSSRYQVSRAVIIRRLLTLDLISQKSFELLRRRYDEEAFTKPKLAGGDYYANKIAHYGTLIPRLAFRAYYDDRATVSDLSMLLGFKAKNLDKLEQRVQGFNYGFG